MREVYPASFTITHSHECECWVWGVPVGGLILRVEVRGGSGVEEVEEGGKGRGLLSRVFLPSMLVCCQLRCFLPALSFSIYFEHVDFTFPWKSRLI
jgi:hypothetical protein